MATCIPLSLVLLIILTYFHHTAIQHFRVRKVQQQNVENSFIILSLTNHLRLHNPEMFFCFCKDVCLSNVLNVARCTRRKVNRNGYSQNRNSSAQLAQREKTVALTV